MAPVDTVEDGDLRNAVKQAYSAAADGPEGAHPFPVGEGFARSVGYPAQLLAALPETSVEAFAGVCNVSLAAEIPPGAAVLDLGCGAGLDSLVAAGRVGPGGRVVGIDFSASMLARARAGARAAGVRVGFCQADGERLPLRDAAVDVALVNGIFNLNPARGALFAELGRVVRPGGVVYAAELIATEAVDRSGPVDLARWFG